MRTVRAGPATILVINKLRSAQNRHGHLTWEWSEIIQNCPSWVEFKILLERSTITETSWVVTKVPFSIVLQWVSWNVRDHSYGHQNRQQENWFRTCISSRAVLTNDHKPGGFKQGNLSSQSWSPDICSQGDSQAMRTLKPPEGLFLHFYLPVVTGNPWGSLVVAA